MNTEKKNEIRLVVRELIEGKVNSFLNDNLFGDNEFRDTVLNTLPTDDPEVEECILRGSDGVCVREGIETFIDTLTNSFMNRFE